MGARGKNLSLMGDKISLSLLEQVVLLYSLLSSKARSEALKEAKQQVSEL